MRMGQLAVFSKPKVLIVIVLALLGLFILSKTSVFHLEPALNAPWLQQLRQTAALDVAQIQAQGGESNRCGQTLDQRGLSVQAGQSCQFTIDPAPRGLLPLTRVLTMTLVAGEIVGPILVAMSFDDRELTSEQPLTLGVPVAVDIPQAGGEITIPTCTRVQDKPIPCVIQVGAYPRDASTPGGLPTPEPGLK
jgi:hypothetical protein